MSTFHEHTQPINYPSSDHLRSTQIITDNMLINPGNNPNYESRSVFANDYDTLTILNSLHNVFYQTLNCIQCNFVSLEGWGGSGFRVPSVSVNFKDAVLHRG